MIQVMWSGSSRLAATDVLDVTWIGAAPVPQSAPSPPRLVLPDRHRLLQRVDDEAPCFEGFVTVRRRCGDDDSGLGHGERTEAMDDRQPPHRRPTQRASPAIAAASRRLARRPRTPTAPRHRDPRRECAHGAGEHNRTAIRAVPPSRRGRPLGAPLQSGRTSRRRRRERARGCIVAGRPRATPA